VSLGSGNSESGFVIVVGIAEAWFQYCCSCAILGPVRLFHLAVLNADNLDVVCSSQILGGDTEKSLMAMI
jgi:hypothetical protein